jgi:hypothetical protein
MNEYIEVETYLRCGKCHNEISYCDCCEDIIDTVGLIYCCHDKHLCGDCYEKEMENRKQK